jgi:hypothetical protein
VAKLLRRTVNDATFPALCDVLRGNQSGTRTAGWKRIRSI